MAQGDSHTARRRVCGKFSCPRQLGREGHQADLALGSLPQPIEDGDIRRQQQIRRMDAAFDVL
jgi:hypothetical protein